MNSPLGSHFKLYLTKEFQSLQEIEQKKIGWDVKRNLTKINYQIHIDAIQVNVSQLVSLANLENLNALFINEGLEKLNSIVIQQMKTLTNERNIKRLKIGNS